MTHLDVHVELLRSGTAAHMSAICLPDVITHDQISQALPLRICILQAIKHGWWERPGNEAGGGGDTSIIIIAMEPLHS